MEKVAMSRFEPEEFINDRYAAMEQRLQVRWGRPDAAHSPDQTGWRNSHGCCSPTVHVQPQQLLHSVPYPQCTPLLVSEHADRPQAPEQAPDTCREGALLLRRAIQPPEGQQQQGHVQGCVCHLQNPGSGRNMVHVSPSAAECLQTLTAAAAAGLGCRVVCHASDRPHRTHVFGPCLILVPPWAPLGACPVCLHPCGGAV